MNKRTVLHFSIKGLQVVVQISDWEWYTYTDSDLKFQPSRTPTVDADRERRMHVLGV
jgi:hypothetical protein